MSNLHIKVADLTIDGRFEAPAFTLFQAESGRIIEAFHAALAPFNFDLGNITFGQVGSLAERNIFFFIPSLNAGIKLTVGRIEIGFNDLNKVTFETINALMQLVDGALATSKFPARIGTYTATLNSHGIIENKSSQDFISPFLQKIPASIGPHLGSGAVFYFGAFEDWSGLALVMDNSGVLDGGLYVRVLLTLDGKKIALKDLAAVGRAALRKAFGAFDLQVQSLNQVSP